MLLGVVSMLQTGLPKSSAAIPGQGQEVSVFFKASTLAVGSMHSSPILNVSSSYIFRSIYSVYFTNHPALRLKVSGSVPPLHHMPS